LYLIAIANDAWYLKKQTNKKTETCPERKLLRTDGFTVVIPNI